MGCSFCLSMDDTDYVHDVWNPLSHDGRYDGLHDGYNQYDDDWLVL